MKAYKRALKPELIKCLNDLYEKKGSWWQTIVDDDEVFILVRENHLRVLVKGVLLLIIKIDDTGKIVCKPPEEHLKLRSEADKYLTIYEDHTALSKCVEGYKEFVRHYGQIKSRINDFVDKERQHCHTMSLKIKEIVDREVGLVLEKSGTNSRHKAQHVDLQAVSDDGKMVFVEVKLLSNNEILPLNMRSVANKHKKYVVTQLKKYEDIIKSHKEEIREAYAEQHKTYLALNGAFFHRKKFPNSSNIKIFPTVRLIITKFEEAPERLSLLYRIREGIEKGMEWKENTDNLIMIDNPNEIIVGDIFKGIQECELI